MHIEILFTERPLVILKEEKSDSTQKISIDCTVSKEMDTLHLCKVLWHTWSKGWKCGKHSESCVDDLQHLAGLI
jgi:hypothetical protein